MKLTVDLIGWIGAGALLFAYAMVSFKKLRADSNSYQVLNAFGSCCLIVNTTYYRAYPSAFVNVIWILIAILASIHARRKPAGSKS
jgi:hypothetical protein